MSHGELQWIRTETNRALKRLRKVTHRGQGTTGPAASNRKPQIIHGRIGRNLLACIPRLDDSA